MVINMINQLKQFRKIRGFTQQQLADIVGVSRNTICSIERGEYKPGLLLALKLNAVMRVKCFHLEWDDYEDLAKSLANVVPDQATSIEEDAYWFWNSDGS